MQGIKSLQSLPSLPRIIAICGLKRSGKDTIADYLCQHYGYTKIRIANPLKQGLKAMFGFSDDQLETDLKDVVDERWGVEPRKIMQFIGTEMMQYKINEVLPSIGRCFWIKSLIEEHISQVDRTNKMFVIPDIRFKHEYDLLSQYNVVFWRVERIRNGEVMLPTNETHASEKEFLDIPVSKILKNNNRLELYRQVQQALDD